jgi:hypothetical protein
MSLFDPKQTSASSPEIAGTSLLINGTGHEKRSQLCRIVLTPEGDVLRAELHGDLAVLARFAQAKEGRAESGDSALRLSVVAGVGFEPTTFRL